MKNKNYSRYLKNEYRKLQINSRLSSNDASNLREMDALLAKIENLKSPEKEHAFVQGILQLNYVPSIAA